MAESNVGYRSAYYAELAVEIVRDELRTISLSLTEAERERREQLVEGWEAGRLTPVEVAHEIGDMWSMDWPDNELTRFIRAFCSDGVPFVVAFAGLSESAKSRLLRIMEAVDG